MLCYVNNVGLTRQPGRCLPPFDGVVGATLELSPEVFFGHLGHDNPVARDEPNFLASPPHVMLVDELRGEPPPHEASAAKAMIFLRRHPDLARDAFEKRLAGVGGEALRLAWGPSLLGLTVNAARPARIRAWGEEWPVYDAELAPCPAVLAVREVIQIDRAPRS